MGLERTLRARRRIPNLDEILLPIYSTWSFQDRVLSRRTPRYLNLLTLSKRVLLISVTSSSASAVLWWAQAMLPSTEFICLRVAYREAFWGELGRPTLRERSMWRPFLFWIHIIFFHSLPSRVGCSFQGKLFSLFKLLCLVLLHIISLPALSSRTLYSLLLHLDPHEKISSPIQDLFCLQKPLTYLGPASVQRGLHGRTEYLLSQALTF